MAKYVRAPILDYDALVEYLRSRNMKHNIACDKDKKITLLEIPDMSDQTFNVFLNSLKNKFPGAF